MTRLESFLAPWLAALIAVVAFFLLVAWAEHDPRDGGWEWNKRADAGRMEGMASECEPRVSGARPGSHRCVPESIRRYPAK